MKKQVITIGKRDFEIGKRPYVMGILNVTPDSFRMAESTEIWMRR